MTSTPPVSQLLTEASSVEQGAIIFDRSGDISRAIPEYSKCLGLLTEALSLIPLSHPDCSALEQHVVEIQSRVSYLSSLPVGVMPSIPLETHISPVQLSINASQNISAGKTMGAAATLGGIGGLLLLGPLGLLAGAAGAAYATTREDNVGSTARDVARTGITALDKVVDIDRQNDISGRAKEFGAHAFSKASEFNQKYEVTDKVKRVSTSAINTVSEINDKYKIADTISSGISAGMATISNFWISSNSSSSSRQYPSQAPPPHQQFPDGSF